MKETDIQTLKYKALQGQYLKANNYIARLEKALAAANAEADGLRELRKSDLAHIGELESENSLLRKDSLEKDEMIADLEARLEEANAAIGRMSRKEEEDSKKLDEAKKTEELLSLSKEAGVDLKNIVSLLKQGKWGRYADKQTGDMHLCFLSNNDITGGNSGSPMFNGRGELIGLAFDGNWDAMSGDISFDSSLQRCIGVDIRFVLFVIDRWGHADNLIKELGL